MQLSFKVLPTGGNFRALVVIGRTCAPLSPILIGEHLPWEWAGICTSNGEQQPTLLGLDGALFLRLSDFFYKFGWAGSVTTDVF